MLISLFDAVRELAGRVAVKYKYHECMNSPRCSSLMTPVMYSLIINCIGVEDDDEDTYWRRISRGQVMNERADPAKLIYINICKRLKITPSAKVADGLSDPTLRISNTSLGSSGIEACAVALVVSIGNGLVNVSRIVLTFNYMLPIKYSA